MKIDIVIPTKNELDNLKIIIPIIKKKYKYPIIIIDKSDDNSVKKLKEFCNRYKVQLFHQKSKGKGNALKEAIKYCKGDIIVFLMLIAPMIQTILKN